MLLWHRSWFQWKAFMPSSTFTHPIEWQAGQHSCTIRLIRWSSPPHPNTRPGGIKWKSGYVYGSRTLLKRGNFTSCDDVRNQILAFIAYDNATTAKPIKWTSTGLS